MELDMPEPSDQASTAIDALSFFREMEYLSRRAHEALARNDVDTVLAALATRAGLIEQSTAIVARFAELQTERQPGKVPDSSPSGYSADVEVLFEAVERAARELRDADACLIERLVAERNRLAGEISVVDHGEAVAATYRQSETAAGTRVDLVR